jgi:hypothetical protein
MARQATRHARPQARPSSSPFAGEIQEAIAGRKLLEFDYHGEHRVVQPYCFGSTPRGAEVLRAIQLRRPNSASRSGGFGFGKLWRLADMRDVRVGSEHFEPEDPDYNPNDSAMAVIFGRI